MTGEFGRRGNLGVPHLVVYGTADELQHVIAPSLEDAMVYAEYLANERDEQCFRVFELREVDMAIKRYYQVALVGSDAPGSGESSTIAPPPGVAELTIVPEPDIDVDAGWPAPAAADVSDRGPDAGEVDSELEPPSNPVRIVELDQLAAATADLVAGQDPIDRSDPLFDPTVDETLDADGPADPDSVDVEGREIADDADTIDGVVDGEVDEAVSEDTTSKAMRISA